MNDNPCQKQRRCDSCSVFFIATVRSIIDKCPGEIRMFWFRKKWTDWQCLSKKYGYKFDFWLSHILISVDQDILGADLIIVSQTIFASKSSLIHFRDNPSSKIETHEMVMNGKDKSCSSFVAEWWRWYYPYINTVTK